MAGAAVEDLEPDVTPSRCPPAHLWIGGFIVCHALGQPSGVERYINVLSTSYFVTFVLSMTKYTRCPVKVVQDTEVRRTNDVPRNRGPHV